ncbi:MAG: PepSY-like domain-containing protein [Rikenellaceae bacterium]|jgi:hypothetical protein
MKRIFLTLAIALATSLTFASCNADNRVPEPVKAAIKNLYPNISKLHWNSEAKGIWEAEFKNNGIQTSVTFDANGTMKEIENEITMSDLPQAVQNYLKQNNLENKVKEIAKIVDANGVITYEAEVKNKDLIFDNQGNIISK